MVRIFLGQALVAVLLASGCQALSGLSDYEVADAGTSGSGAGASAPTSGAAGGSGESSTGAGGDGAGAEAGSSSGGGGAGGDPCEPVEEICANAVDEDCDGLDCSETAWAVAFGGAARQTILSVAVLPSGSIAIAGTYAEGAMTIGDMALPEAIIDGTALFYALLEPDGTPIWSLGIEDAANGLPVVGADDGAVVLSGRFRTAMQIGDVTLAASGSGDPFVARVSEEGIVEWAFALAGNGIAHIRDLEVRGNELLIGGAFATEITIGPLLQLLASGGEGDTDGFVAVLDGESGEGFDGIRIGWIDASLQAVNGAGYLGGGDVGVVASFQSGVEVFEPVGGSGFAVAALDAGLQPQWQRIVRSSNLLASSLIVDDVAVRGKRIAVTGRVAGPWEVVENGTTTAIFQTTGPEDVDIFLAVWDDDGTLRWAKQLGDAGDQSWSLGVLGLELDDDDGVVLAGGFRGEVDPGGGMPLFAAQSDWLVAAFDDGGLHRWSRRFSAEGDQDGASCVSVDPRSGQLVVGGVTGAPLDITDPPLELVSGDPSGTQDVVLARLGN